MVNGYQPIQQVRELDGEPAVVVLKPCTVSKVTRHLCSPRVIVVAEFSSGT